MNTLEIKNDVYWVGALDPKLKVFDIIMETEFGTTYNSYFIKGSEKTVLLETVKVKFFDQYIKKLSEYIDIENLDYIIVNHTEPDHAGSIEKILKIAPNIKIVGSDAAISFLKDICNTDFKSISVTTGDTLNLGNKTLKFISAPFLHWPDSMYTYLAEDNILFTCDSFGSHYSFDEILFSKLGDKKDDYMKALDYYFQAIFSPFKKYILEALEKIKDYKIDIICTGHGPVLDKNPQEIMDIYRKWSTETNPNDKKTIVIPYVSAYGYTEELQEKILDGIKSVGDFNIKTYNLNIANYGELKASIMEEIYWADAILFGTSTINGDALPPIWDLAISLNPIVHGEKVASAFGSFGWSGEAVPNILERFDQVRMKTVDGFNIKFKGSEKELADAFNFGKNFAKYILSGDVPARTQEEAELAIELNPSGESKLWKCIVCGAIFEGVLPPKICPACGVGQEMFEELIEEKISFNSNTKQDILIIGNGAAGIATAEAIRKRNKECNVTIITNEKISAYYRPSISDYLTEEIADEQFYLKKTTWYQDNNINVLLGVEITKIDAQNQEITLSNNSKKSYDKLVLANGSRCALPPIKNINVTGTFTLRSYEDANKIKAYAKNAKRLVIIGGGVLGLETASEMKSLGLDVSIIEMETRIFPRQLDEDGSKILEKMINKADINVYKNQFVKSIKGNTKVTGVELSTGKVIDADMVIISAGIKSNKQIAEDAGIEANRGVVVDKNMKTNFDNIYAAGDIAEFDGLVVGIWSTALDQGQVAGANIVGDNLEYNHKSHPVTFTGMNVEIFSIGDIGTDETINYQIAEFKDPINNIYKKIFFEKGIIVGGILIGDISKGNVLIDGLKKKAKIEDVVKKFY